MSKFTDMIFEYRQAKVKDKDKLKEKILAYKVQAHGPLDMSDDEYDHESQADMIKILQKPQPGEEKLFTKVFINNLDFLDSDSIREFFWDKLNQASYLKDNYFIHLFEEVGKKHEKYRMDFIHFLFVLPDWDTHLVSIASVFTQNELDTIYVNGARGNKKYLVKYFQKNKLVSDKIILTEKAIYELREDKLTINKLQDYTDKGIDTKLIFNALCIRNKRKLFEYLFKKDPSLYDQENLETILRHSNYEVLDFLIQQKVVLNKPFTNSNLTPIFMCVKNRDLHCLDQLLNLNCDLNINHIVKVHDDSFEDEHILNETALSYAIKDDDAELVQKLLSYPGIDVTIPDNKPLKYAIESGNDELISILKEKGARLTEHESNELLYEMIRKDNAKAIQKCIELGATFTKVMPLIYEDEALKFNKMIILPSKETKPFVAPSEFPKKIIFNLEGYDEGISIPTQQDYIEGNALKLPNGTPISYVINLPNGDPSEIKGVFVKVYGGNTSEDRLESLELPGQIGDIGKALLKNGIAVITLNLVDLIKQDKNYYEMSNELHNELHQSIALFHDTLKNHPEKLHPDLVGLNKKPICLFGASFGGRTAIKHAELYPHQFDGYISFDGWLSSETDRQTTTQIMQRAVKAEPWLEATQGIEDIESPILLLHNINDNNVNLKVTLDWYTKACMAGKKELIRLLITEKGDLSPIRESAWSTGHFHPAEKEAMERLVSQISDFIISGPSCLPEVTDWLAHRYDMVADKNLQKASIEQYFTGILFDKYTKQKKLPSEEEMEMLFFSLSYLASFSHQEEELKNALCQLDAAGKLTDEHLKKGLMAHFNSFKQYIKALFEDINFSQTDQEYMTPDLIYTYWKLLTSHALSPTSTLPMSLFLSNPDLIQDSIKKYQQDPAMRIHFNRAKNKFNQSLKTEHAKVKSAWQAAAEKSLPPSKRGPFLKKIQRGAISEIEQNKSEILKSLKQSPNYLLTLIETTPRVV